jgi:hypothetical protein
MGENVKIRCLCGSIVSGIIYSTRALSFQLNLIVDGNRKFVDLSLTVWFVVCLVGYALHFGAEMLTSIAW